MIYIPIWLDLLYAIQRSVADHQKDLHSNMVRFIIIHIIHKVMLE